MDSASYWNERQRIADAAMERDERLLSERIKRVYERELKDLDRQVADYYKRYGEDNVIAYRHLMETLDQADRDLLIRDCDKFLISHPETASIVDVRKSIYKLNRLEGLQASARLRLYSATDEVSGAVTDHLAKQALRGANTTAQAMGFGKSFYKLDNDFIRRFVDTPWTGGARYSQRIWDNADTLAAYVGQDMAKAFARGDSYERIAKALSKRFVDVPQSSLMRLVYTEGTYTSRAAQAEELKRESFEEYTVEVVHDGHTCEECHAVDGKVFRFDDAEPGVNFPPIHPYCRCQIAPAVTDWDAWQQKQLDKKQAERAAKAVDDKGGRVEKHSKANHSADVYRVLGDDELKVIDVRIEKADPKARELYLKHESEFKTPIKTKNKQSFYRPYTGQVTLNVHETFGGSKIEPGDTWFHEFGHNIDFKHGKTEYHSLSHSFENGAFSKALMEDVKNAEKRTMERLVKDLPNMIKNDPNGATKAYIAGMIKPEDYRAFKRGDITIEEVVSRLRKPKISSVRDCLSQELASLPSAEQAGVSDMFEGATHGKIKGRWGHGPGYWDKENKALSQEAFAEMFAGSMGSDISLGKIKEYFPNAYKVFERMIEVMLND